MTRQDNPEQEGAHEHSQQRQGVRTPSTKGRGNMPKSYYTHALGPSQDSLQMV